MGYDTELFGEIGINPPLKWGEIWQHHASAESSFPFRIKIRETFTHDEEGTFNKREGISIIPTTSPARHVKSYADELQSIVSDFAGHDFGEGYIEGRGEDPSDCWRLYVRDGDVIKIKAKTVWPPVPG